MKRKRKTRRKLLSFLLTLALSVGLLQGMGLTAWAAPPTNTDVGIQIGDVGIETAYYTITPSNLNYPRGQYDALATNVALPYQTNAKDLMSAIGYNSDSIKSITNVSISSGTNVSLGSSTGNPGENNYNVDISITNQGEAVVEIVADATWSETITCRIAVSVYPADVILPTISLEEDELSIAIGNKMPLTATITPDNATDKTVKWSVSGTNPDAIKLYSDENCTTEIGSDATSVLTVYAKGMLAGDATVSVTSNSYTTRTASCNITVSDRYNLWIGGEEVTSLNSSGVGWSYDVGSNTIALSNYSYAGVGYKEGDSDEACSAICYTGSAPLIIRLSGTNKITRTGSSDSRFGDASYCGIHVKNGADLTITGSSTDSLNVTCEGHGSSAIYLIGGDTTLTVQNVSLTTVTMADSGNPSISCRLVKVVQGASVTATGGYNGISANVEIDENSSLTAAGYNKAIAYTIKNTISGTGWTDKNGTEEQASIDISTEGHDLSTYKKVQFPAVVAHTHDDIIFTAWDKTDSLPTAAGSYYLTGNVELSDYWSVSSGGVMNLCLNGNSIKGPTDSGPVFNVYNGTTLNLYDCDVTAGAIIARYKNGVEVAPGSTFNLYGGKITSNTDNQAIGVENFDTFNMYGGEISGYKDTGVSNVNGTFTMKGGTIRNNGKGVTNNDTFQLSGNPTITNNKSGTGDSVKDNNVSLANNKVITIDGVLSNTTPIGVTMSAPGVFASGWNTYMSDKTPTDYFVSDDSVYTVQTTEEKELKLATAPANTYSLTLNTNGGTINSGNITSYTEGTGATLPTDLTKTNYTFGGWYADSNFTGSAVTTIGADATGNKEFWAKWTENSTPPSQTTYTITFNSKGGSDVAASNVTSGSKVSKPNNPTRDGYTFLGWSKEETSSTYYDFDTVVTSSLTLYAQWEKKVETRVSDTSDIAATVEGLGDAIGTSDLNANQYVTSEIEVDNKTASDVSKTVSSKVDEVKRTDSSITVNYLTIDISKIITTVASDGSTTDGTKTAVTELTKPIEVAIPNITGNKVYIVREHDGTATQFTEIDSRKTTGFVDGEFYYDSTNKIVYIYSSKFSTYAILTKPAGSGGGGGTTPVTPGKTTPAKPSAPVLEGKTDTTITVKAVSGQEYSIDGGKNWQTSGTFTGLTPETEYSIVTKITATGTANESPVSDALKVTTDKKADPSTPTPGGPGSTTTPTDEPTETPGSTTAPTDTPGTTTTPGATDTPSTTTTPGATSAPADKVTKTEKAKAKLSLNAGLKVSYVGKKVTVKWGKVSKADRYVVYAAYCGSDKCTKVGTVSGSKQKYTFTKLNGKKLNLKKNVKVYVVAYRKVNGKETKLAKSITAHVVGTKNAKYTNVKKIKLSKSSYTLKANKTETVKAEIVLEDKKKKQLSDGHAPEFRYASSNTKVATVDANGRIKAVGKGTCCIYVYAKNGYAKKIKVVVK